MLTATKVKMSGSEKKWTGTPQHFLHKKCNWKVSGSSRRIRSKQRQRNVEKKRAKLFFANKKKVCCTCNFFFLFWLIIDLLIFIFFFFGGGGAVFVYILFSKLYILTRASLLALAKSIYWLHYFRAIFFHFLKSFFQPMPSDKKDNDS